MYILEKNVLLKDLYVRGGVGLEVGKEKVPSGTPLKIKVPLVLLWFCLPQQQSGGPPEAKRLHQDDVSGR